MQREEFEKLYNQHYKDVYYIALKIVGNEETAKDIAQEAFIRAYTKIDTLEDISKFKPWISSITNNLSINLLKRNKIVNFESMDAEESFEIADEKISPEDKAVEKDVQEILLSLINSLPEEQKLTVFLFYYEEISVKEIAKLCGCPEKTIYSRLAYAKKALRDEVEKLEDKGVKLRCIAALPFIYLIFRMEAKEAYAQSYVPEMKTNATIIKETGAKMMKGKLIGIIGGVAAAIAAAVVIVVNVNNNKDDKKTLQATTAYVENITTSDNTTESITTVAGETTTAGAVVESNNKYTDLKLSDLHADGKNVQALVGNIKGVYRESVVGMYNYYVVSDTGIWTFDHMVSIRESDASKCFYQVYKGNDIKDVVFCYDSVIVCNKTDGKMLAIDTATFDPFASKPDEDDMIYNTYEFDAPSDMKQLYCAIAFNKSFGGTKNCLEITYISDENRIKVMYFNEDNTSKVYFAGSYNLYEPGQNNSTNNSGYYVSIGPSYDIDSDQKYDGEIKAFYKYYANYALLNSTLCKIQNRDYKSGLPCGVALAYEPTEGNVAYEDGFGGMVVNTVTNVTNIYDQGTYGSSVFFGSEGKLCGIIAVDLKDSKVMEIPMADLGHGLEDIKSITSENIYAYVTFNDNSIYVINFKNYIDDEITVKESVLSQYNKDGHLVDFVIDHDQVIAIMDDNYTYEIKE